MQVNDLLEVGDWDRADDTTAEVLRLSEETGQPGWSTGAIAVDARFHALRGDAELGLVRASEAEVAALPRRLNCYLACVQGARGVAWLAAGRPADAYRELSRLFDPTDPAFHQREGFMGITFLAEAAVASGRTEDVRELLGRLEQTARVTPSPMLAVHLGYARAVLARDDEAEGLFTDALESDLTRWPIARARLLLARGTRLRRQRRDDEAWPALLEAEAMFDRIGAVPWGDQTRAEMDALGTATQT
jgi:tetratricopeptide (TPR) repeat protein